MYSDDKDLSGENHEHHDHHHHGHVIRVRRRRKSQYQRGGAKLNPVHIIIALVVGLMVSIYIINQNHNEATPPPQARIETHQLEG